MPLRLLTLGPPRVFQHDTELADLPAQRLRFALLVFLAVEGETSREAVLSLFWPDRDPSRARHALRQMLYELRQLLGEDWVDIARDRVTVHAQVDAAQFEAAAAEDRADDALALYCGPFLDGFSLDNHAFEGWLDRRRAQFGRSHRRLRRDAIARRLAAGDADGALQLAQQWVELDPLEDEASHALIRALALTGQRLAALQYYQSHERQLAAELQVEPLEETRALVEQIRAGTGEFEEPAQPAATPTQSPAPAHAVTPLQSAAPAQAAPPTQSVAPAQTPPPTQSVAPQPSPAEPPWGAAARLAAWRRGRNWWPGALAAAVLLLVLTAAAVGYRTDQPRSAEEPGARIMILPFTDRSDDGELSSLASALTESLARNLAQSQRLDVVSPTGVTLLRGRGVSEDSLRRLLRADYLVSGSISSDGDRVRVGVELLDGRSGSVVRSEVVERELIASRVLVDDVIERTTVVLRREVGNHVEVRRVRSQTGSEEAWRNVLEARALQEPLPRLIMYRDRAGIERAMDQADSLLARAGELDRRWAEPLVMRGWLMERRSYIGAFTATPDSASRRKALEVARAMADRAIERDPREARAYELRGTVVQQLALLPGQPRDSVPARLELAERELLRATQLDPTSASSWRRLADVRYRSGHYAAAKGAAERAYRIDRFVVEARGVVQLLFSTSLELGEDAEAERWCMEGRRSYPNVLPFMYCLFELHAWTDYIRPDVNLLRAELQQYRQMHATLQPELLFRFETLLAAAYVRAGQPDSARAILRRTAGTGHDDAQVWMRAGVHGMLGDDDEALAMLATFVNGSYLEDQRVLRTRPFWRFRGNPEYEKLLAR